jgi:NitT/TauT family transport system substrate-binding protein
MILRIGHLSTFYHTSILLSAGKNIEKQLGVTVDWKLFGTGPEIINAFLNEELHLAYVGLPPVIIGIDRGIALKCIAGGHVEGTVFCGKKQFKGFPELEDLGDILRQFVNFKIGVPGQGSIHDVILTECLERAGFKNEVKVIRFQWADQILDAMHKGHVSGAVGTPALAIALKSMKKQQLF